MIDFDTLHEVHPGKHFYQFYRTPQDLLSILAPYFRMGISKGNYCFWVVPAFMTIEEARGFLKEQVASFPEHEKKGAFELMPHVDWYGDGNTFDGDLVIDRYMSKLKKIMSQKFSIVRAAADASAFKPTVWPQLRSYEKKAHNIMQHIDSAIALCSYPIHDLSLQETKDVLDCHHGVLVARM